MNKRKNLQTINQFEPITKKYKYNILYNLKRKLIYQITLSSKNIKVNTQTINCYYLYFF